jgi:HEAT repeat protein
MSEENTTDNLRRFLESDDPAKVLMGLSMAKGTGVDESLLPLLSALGLVAEQKEIRSKAAQLFKETALAENKKLFDELSQAHDEPCYELSHLDDQSALFAVKVLNFALGSASALVVHGAIKAFVPELVDWNGFEAHWSANPAPNLSRALAITSALGNEPTVQLLEDLRKIIEPDRTDELTELDWLPILMLFAEDGCLAVVEELTDFIDDEGRYQSYDWGKVREVLASLGAPAVEPLLALIADQLSHLDRAYDLGVAGMINVLGQIGDPRAVEPLRDVLLFNRATIGEDCVLYEEDTDFTFYFPWDEAAEALKAIGGPAAVAALTTVLQAQQSHPKARTDAARALGEIGDASAVVPLLQGMCQSDEYDRDSFQHAVYDVLRRQAGFAIKSPQSATTATKTANLLRFLTSDDSAKVLMGLSMAKGLATEDEAEFDESLLGILLTLAVFEEAQEIHVAAEQLFLSLAPAACARLVNLLNEPPDNFFEALAIIGPTAIVIVAYALIGGVKLFGVPQKMESLLNAMAASEGAARDAFFEVLNNLGHEVDQPDA